MFRIYCLVYFKNGLRYAFYDYDLLNLLKDLQDYSYWYIEVNEIIEGLFYPVKIIARSSVCGIK